MVLLLLLVLIVSDLPALSSRFSNPLPDSASVLRVPLSEDFSLAAENDRTALYLNEQSLAIRILNKKTGYVWSSDVADFGEERLNDKWKAFINSGITIEYYLERKNAAGGTTVDRRSTEESFLESGTSTVVITKIDGGFRAATVFGTSGIGISYETKLGENGIEITVNPDTITETDTARIVSVQFYPFLGAVRQGTQDGYFLLPDGDGSLVRFDRIYNNITKNYQKKYFGDDRGIAPAVDDGMGFIMESQRLNYNVYGIVHGVRDNALMTEIKSGSPFAELLVYPAGVRTNYYFISNRYLYRQPYTYIVSSGTQATMITPRRAEFAIRECITLLDGTEADYSGIARAYRNSLTKDGLLLSRVQKTQDIPINLDLLAGAANEGILWNSNVVMTSIDDVEAIAGGLNASGVHNLRLRYSNLFRNTLSASERDRYRLRPGIGNTKKLTSLTEKLSQAGNRLIVETSPSDAFSKIAGLDMKEDVIRNMNRRYFIISQRFGAVNKEYHVLNSSGVSKLILRDAGELAALGIDSLQLYLSSPASSFNEQTVWRETAVLEIAAALVQSREKTKYISIESRYAMPWFYPSMDALTGVGMSTALYPYITDTVPFTSLVLHGSMDLFTGDINNASNPEENLLRMIEWGVYPSFFITMEDSTKLLYSDAEWVLASRYDDWRDEIIGVYGKVNAALRSVVGQDIVYHGALADGVMITRYANGVSVYVNYNSQGFTGDGITIAPMGYEVRYP
ncbi:hypothetical protein FACS1894141_0800 [Spirochaetia bacterium]|nr:hypothetical protein FACS1894141_0800 [Spirochaetia bacterium]